MSSKGGGTQGYRYYMSLLMGLCRGPLNELVQIKVGDKIAWTGNKCGGPEYIDKPALFGGDDKEGGIQGPFDVFMGAPTQILPGDQIVKGEVLPDVKASIGGLVSQMRGVAMLWFDGMVSAMNPYLKEWKVRVRRSTAGWYNDNPWYPEKATIFLGGAEASASSNAPVSFPIINGNKINFNRNIAPGDVFTINGVTLTIVDDDDPADFEVKPNSTRERSVRNIANYVNARSTDFKATATYTATSVSFTMLQQTASIYAMNASHIVYECFTDKLWGRGLDAIEDIDENSFIYAANTLCSENFGLCIGWYRKEDIDVFIRKVCDLVGGLTYTDRETGKTVFKLIRDDYEIDDLPLYTPETGLLSIDSDDSEASDGAFNEIIGTSIDPLTNLEFQRRVHNLAAHQSQGAPSSLDQDYKGIPTKQLMDRVLLRDLRAMSSGLKKYTLTLDRRGWRVAPGSVIRISHPARGFQNLVLRVGEIDDGNLVNGQIRIKAAIDVFGLPATSYQGIVDNGWVAPSTVAVPAPEERLVEAGYRELYLRLGATETQATDPTAAYIGQLAREPNGTSQAYDLTTKVEGGEYSVKGTGPFTGSAFLTAPVGPTDIAFPLTKLNQFGPGNLGEALLIGDEIVAFDEWDADTKIATVRRGAADTIPQAHGIEDPLWTIDDDLVPDGIAYAAGETVFSKVLTRTSSEVLDPALADENEIELVGRHAKPYPPADVQIDGESIYTADLTVIRAEPEITWVDRNRLTQADTLLGNFEAGTAPEEGATVTIYVYLPDEEEPVATYDGIDGNTWTYTGEMQADDGVTGGAVRIEVGSKRDGLESYQRHSFGVVLSAGWGYGWGNEWGGD